MILQISTITGFMILQISTITGRALACNYESTFINTTLYVLSMPSHLGDKMRGVSWPGHTYYPQFYIRGYYDGYVHTIYK